MACQTDRPSISLMRRNWGPYGPGLSERGLRLFVAVLRPLFDLLTSNPTHAEFIFFVKWRLVYGHTSERDSSCPVVS